MLTTCLPCPSAGERLGLQQVCRRRLWDLQRGQQIWHRQRCLRRAAVGRQHGTVQDAAAAALRRELHGSMSRHPACGRLRMAEGVEAPTFRFRMEPVYSPPAGEVLARPCTGSLHAMALLAHAGLERCNADTGYALTPYSHSNLGERSMPDGHLWQRHGGIRKQRWGAGVAQGLTHARTPGAGVLAGILRDSLAR